MTDKVVAQVLIEIEERLRLQTREQWLKPRLCRHAIEQLHLILPNHVGTAAQLVFALHQLLDGIAHEHIRLTAELLQLLKCQQQILAKLIQIPQSRDKVIRIHPISWRIRIPILSL